ncbi:MAG: hypothetical protein H0V70_18570 [Ktedonobacteraceae bacterium]|nr:hypothetical protein [Ktedonobacteraceae bacterium]
MQRKRAQHVLLLCFGAVLLAACGAQQANASNAGSGSNPTPTVSAATSGKVMVTVGKAHYASNATMMVTINNGLAQSIVAANHQSGCTMVTLQWQDAQGSWQDMNHCRQGAMTRMITLPAHSSQVQVISPTSGTFARNAQWAKGTYRIVFNFTVSTTDVESIPINGSGSPIYSSTFVVA